MHELKQFRTKVPFDSLKTIVTPVLTKLSTHLLRVHSHVGLLLPQKVFGIKVIWQHLFLTQKAEIRNKILLELVRINKSDFFLLLFLFKSATRRTFVEPGTVGASEGARTVGGAGGTSW